MSKNRFDYAVVFLEYLRGRPQEFIEVETVAKKFKLPPSYLEKVAQELRRGGWIESKKGAGGGYRLTKNHQTISIQSLINFFDPIYAFCPVLRDKYEKNDAKINI